MSEPTSRLPARPSLEQLRRRAKDLLRAVRAGDQETAARFRAADARWSTTDPAAAILADAQLVIAREHRAWRGPEPVGGPVGDAAGVGAQEGA